MLALDCDWERLNEWILIPLVLIYFVDSFNFMGSSDPKLCMYVSVVTRPKKAQNNTIRYNFIFVVFIFERLLDSVAKQTRDIMLGNPRSPV